MAVPILDNHVHLEPTRGRNIEAVRDFERVGGTHIIVSHQPYKELRVDSLDDFRKSFDLTISTVERINSETSVKAYATVGPYPVELLHLEKRLGLEKAKETMKDGMAIAAEYVREGKALAIGEVGRPHFEVSERILEASNDILADAMSLAREEGCAIVLHTETGTKETMMDLAKIADDVGLDRAKVVKHYSPPIVLPEENFGLMPSVLASKEGVREALSKGTRFMMETDFLDDPRRPGAVMAITTVPKRTLSFISQGLMTEEQAHTIHFENPREVYGPSFG
ncbi:MAG: TatD family hydrolase [Methanobacteriota archaeon]|nr:MAG: TatD family hydrolase [Euryarchaeota archaeon]